MAFVEVPEKRSESPKKVSHAVTAAEFKKKVDNR